VPTAELLLAGVALLLLFPFLAWGDRVVFNAATGRMTYGWWGRQGRPLTDVLAVQLIPGEVQRHLGEEGGEYQTYQLNLVLDDARCPRFNLSDHADLAWTRRAGAELADFLGVPLLDQLPEGGSAATASPPPALMAVGVALFVTGALGGGLAALTGAPAEWLAPFVFTLAGLGMLLLGGATLWHWARTGRSR
jgi:hypothetical protein